MMLGTTVVDATFAEAFRMWAVRLWVTSLRRDQLETALAVFCGYGTSVIACEAEVGTERLLPSEMMPDDRPGTAVLVFGMSLDALNKYVAKRVGQCLMTCPGTAVYDGLPSANDRVPLGQRLRFFGDGYQKSKRIAGQRYWRIPIMEGEFVCADTVGAVKAIGGGNFQIEAVDLETGLAAARRAVAAIAPLPDVITPFPGGVVGCGSKVGSRVKGLFVSTNEVFAPSLRSRVPTQLHDGVNSVVEVVIDGLTEQAIRSAMRVGLQAAAGPDVVALSAGNFGGKLGKFQFPLHEILAAGAEAVSE